MARINKSFSEQRLSLLQAFVETATLRSFAGAAQRLQVTASTVSRRVAKLEAELGASLLTRTTRSVVLTEAGSVYLRYAQRILLDLSEADAVVAELGGHPAGTLTIGAPSAWGRMFLGPLIAQFLERYPDVRVDVRLTDARVDLVDERLDVSIRIGQLDDSTLRAHRLLPNHRRIFAAPCYLERFGRPKHPMELAEHRCLMFSRLATGRRWVFQQAEQTLAIDLEPWVSSDDVSVLLAIATAGEGLLMLADFMADPQVEAGTLTPILEEWSIPESNVYAVYPSVRWVPPKTRAFIDHLVAFATTVRARPPERSW